MATRADILADVKGLVGTDPHASDAEINTLIQTRFDRIYESWSWSRRLRDLTISPIAQVSSTSTTLVTATINSPVITSAGTPFTTAMAGRQIAISGEVMYFFIDSVTSTAVVRLGDGEGTEVNWPAATAASKTWRVFQTLYTLPSTAESVVSLVGANPMTEYDGGREALDAADPYRLTTGSDPLHWLYAGEDTSSARQVEIWPVPTAARLLRGQFLRATPTLAATTTIPVSRAQLVYLTTADVLNMLHAKTGDESYRQLALFYVREGDAATSESRFTDQERLSLPASLGRALSQRRGVGEGYWVTHDRDLG